eukprot:9232719-Alexandrium_andersonii.AAC.1
MSARVRAFCRVGAQAFAVYLLARRRSHKRAQQNRTRHVHASLCAPLAVFGQSLLSSRDAREVRQLRPQAH